MAGQKKKGKSRETEIRDETNEQNTAYAEGLDVVALVSPHR